MDCPQNAILVDPAFLAHRLVEGLEREPQAQAILRRVLGNADVPSYLPPSVFGWMRRFPALKEVHHAMGLLDGEKACVPLALGPLLVWASRQPWHEDVQWEHFLAAWPNAMLIQRRDPHALHTMVLAWQLMKPTWTQLPLEYQRLTMKHWLDNERVAPTWEPPWYTKDENLIRAQLWSVLMDTAQNMPDPTALNICHSAFERSLLSLNTWHQEEMLLHVLASPLDLANKCRLACGVDARVWHDTRIQKVLLSVLPRSEVQRLAMLPWVLPAGWPGKKGRLMYMQHEAVHANKTTVQNYCPTLYATLVDVVAKEDWLHPTRMRSTVALMSAADTLPLPLNWETA